MVHPNKVLYVTKNLYRNIFPIISYCNIFPIISYRNIFPIIILVGNIEVLNS